MAGVELPLRAIREQIACAFDLIVHLTRLVDGCRRVSHVTEVSGSRGRSSRSRTCSSRGRRARRTREATWTAASARRSARRGCGRTSCSRWRRTASSSPANLTFVGTGGGVKCERRLLTGAACFLCSSWLPNSPTPALRPAHVGAAGSSSYARSTQARPADRGDRTSPRGRGPGARSGAPPRERATAVAGRGPQNLGKERAKKFVRRHRPLAVDARAADPSTRLAAAQGSSARKAQSDRIELLAFGSQAVDAPPASRRRRSTQRSRFSLARGRPRPGNRSLRRRPALVGGARRPRRSPSRVLILLTDGQEVSSKASPRRAAIAAARKAGVTVYPIAIESASFSPAPLKQLAKATGGRYTGARDSASLVAVYNSIAAELRRTWQLTYTTAARPGEEIRLAGGGASLTSTIARPLRRRRAASTRRFPAHSSESARS